MQPSERWLVSPAEMLEMSLHKARGPMVVDDLQALPKAPLVIAEGSTLPAAAVDDHSRAVWLLPTPQFQRARLAERRLPAGPHELFVMLAATIEREAHEHGVRVLTVDGTRDIDAVAHAVERLLGGALAEGPCAESLEERRGLLREANEAVVEQVRGYYARPWADGDANAVLRAFICECGDRQCVASVEVPVGVAAAAPVVAADHR